MQGPKARQSVLWSMPNGIRCVVLRYDEERFQLKLVRDEGTIRSDLFRGYARALEAARDWLDRINAPSSFHSDGR